MALNNDYMDKLSTLSQRHDSQCPPWAIEFGETLIRTSARHTASLNARHKKQGIKLTPLSLLYAIMDHQGEASQKDLAEHFPYSMQAMTLALNWLEAGGYIERRPDQTDKRANLIALTEKGVDCIDEALDYREEFYKTFMSMVTEEEISTVIQVLNRIDDFYRSTL